MKSRIVFCTFPANRHFPCLFKDLPSLRHSHFRLSQMHMFLLVSLLLVLPQLAAAQEQGSHEREVVQVSGLVIESETEEPLPYVNVHIKGSASGAVTTLKGFFSLPVAIYDTLVFSSIGYKRASYVVPPGLDERKTWLEVKLERDTIVLEEARVYPWTRDQFKQAFLALDLSDPALEAAMENMDPQVMNDLRSHMVMSAAENQTYYFRQMANSYYYAGQSQSTHSVGGMAIPSTLTNPVAWYQFFRALKNGDFKRKE